MAGSALVILFFGKRMRFKGAEVGITAVALALAMAVAGALEVFPANVATAHEAEEYAHEHEGEVAVAAAPGATFAAESGGGEGEEGVTLPEEIQEYRVERSVGLSPIGGVAGIDAGIRVDGLTAMMFLLITFVSLMVHVYSTSYMHGDPRYTWYFALLSMFTASMLLLVVADNLLQVLVGWELVGICSFLLIGFWWEEKANQDAAIKAFLTTKLGDVGLMVGIIVLWSMFGTFDIGAIYQGVAEGGYSQGLLTFGLLALFVGAVGKSAQFPLHTWLPDAMAGPTPVSALIHAATMVTAGIFLVARLYPVYQASPTALSVIAIVGVITLFAMGLLALVQDDVKKVLAYSTISQLGYMVAALAFSYTAGIFHLFTHGFFKALLFLGAGSLIHSVHSNNMSDMGGLRRVMPVTFWTFLVGSVALAALPPLAGFWSKDEILTVAADAGSAEGWTVAILGGLGGLVTAFYMTRVLYLVFAGEYRGHGHPHESPAAMRWPLVILAVPAALIGLVNLPFPLFEPIGFAAWTMFDAQYFIDHPAQFNILVAGGSTLLAVVGILAARALYRTAPAPAQDPMLNLGGVTRVLQNRYYLDWLYTNVIVAFVRDRLSAAAYWFNNRVLDGVVDGAGRGAVALGQATYRVDQQVIDGAVNGVGATAGWTGNLVRFAQSGNVQLYAGAMFVGVLVLGVLFAVA
jgi:NADH-quinone oxidoreductase subunit L